MKRHATTPTDACKPRPDWKRLNPKYQYSPPSRVSLNGKPCVEVDGGALCDLLATVEYMGRKK